MKRAVAVVAMFLIGVYVADYLSLRFRIPDREPFGTVQVSTYYAVKLKNRKTEIMPAEPSTEQCVHSLFPHMGRTPCWYLERHRQKQIDIGEGGADPPVRARPLGRALNLEGFSAGC